MIMSALHSGHLSLRWCTVSAHDSQKRWCPQGTRALRGSLRLIRQTLQQSSNALAAGSDVTAASSGGVWSIVFAASSSAPSSSSSESLQRCSFSAAVWAPMWHGVRLHRWIRAAVSASRASCILACSDCPLPHCAPLPYRADKSTPALSTPANSAFPNQSISVQGILEVCKFYRSICIFFTTNQIMLIQYFD